MTDWQQHAECWAYAYERPVANARIKSQPSHFKVFEVLGFEPSGHGEFVLVEIEKTQLDTPQAGALLARYCNLPRSSVSHAGLKDRHAVCRQFFSIHLPGRSTPDFKGLDNEQLKLISIHRHQRKLRPAAIQFNRFELVLDALEAHTERLDQRLLQVSNFGVPNYFGLQRFGRHFSNLNLALAMAGNTKRRVDRMRRSLAISAARSWIFNQVLSERVNQKNWAGGVNREVWMLRDSNSVFGPDELTPEIAQRAELGEIDTSGPMWGQGKLRTEGELAELEGHTASEAAPFDLWLAEIGLKQERRRLRLQPRQMTWSRLSENQMALRFILPRGCFATAVLREICGWD